MLSSDTNKAHLWRKTAPARATAPGLAGDQKADVLVVGGGFTGLAAALGAADAGARVMLLEGGKVGGAASGRNNGLVISHHSKAAPSEIEKAWGKTYGDRYNGLVANAAPVAFGLLQRFAIDAHQVQTGWIQPAHSAAALARTRVFHDEWKAFGLGVEWLERDEISDRIGSAYPGGWIVHNSGHVNPYAMAIGLANAIERLGVRIFENTRAVSITKATGGWRVATAQGSITAPEVVLATNALTGDIWPRLHRTMIPVTLYQAASAPLSAALRKRILIGNPAVSDTRRDIRAFHYDRDHRIVTAGTLTSWHNAEKRGKVAASRLLAKAFPALGPAPQVDEYWEGTFAVVPDRKPRLFRLAPGLVFGGIYSGRGVALALSLGQEIGLWAAGRRGDGDMPLPVTDLRTVPFQPVAVQVAKHIHPLHRLQDKLS